ncbi:nuclear transcription factor Y subunit C-9-like protein [Trifolium pratense]|uniref:Nuclear transcription factor Y subunit C-9-like protein n=1 Tax=Trifolium pratense TaxID=57577 RepID=A0A2K3M3C4_TRIPR|nr:nuclear transcription factor Y subunit C-9-like protein [Trifolium pratense]
MDQKNQEQPREQENHAPTGTQVNGENQNHSNQIMQLPHPLIHSAGASTFSSYLSRDPFQHFPHKYFNQQNLQTKLATFWAIQNDEIRETMDFKTHRIPLLRIKKIMKADEQVNKISADAPILFAKACEMFIMELTIRSWANADFNRRRTLHKGDIASAISNTDVFDFLVDIVPKEDTMEHDIFKDIPRSECVPLRNVNVPYYVPVSLQPQYVPMQPQYAAGPSYSYGPQGMLMGGHVLNQPYYNMQQLPQPFANQRFAIQKQENDESTDLPGSEN